jgi:hypothetical protein
MPHPLVKAASARRFKFAGDMMMKRVLLAVLLVVSPFAAARAQGTPEQRIQAARRQAEQAGIPVSLLDTKVTEGRAKGVPMDRIAAAVERRLGSLGRAREAMAPRAPVSAADLSVGADAIETGVEPRALGQLAAAAPAGQRAVAIAVLTQLVASGLPSDRALERVTAALERGPEALRQLPGQASEEARGRGNSGNNGRGPAATPGSRGNGRGRGNQGGGPPASVPGPKKDKPDRPGNGGGNGNRP